MNHAETFLLAPLRGLRLVWFKSVREHFHGSPARSRRSLAGSQ
ncbi:hypothetical protein HSR122_1192 [Halapricum desulfuricans]|uniref:Uncharacterized protein n=1 Tax=Halapricum desulfuricans TaxID=2841257 RepID=A0A897N816_9EURY|nr:hypothetical protein HSR122_1192 [Halapricum desulfuricans]